MICHESVHDEFLTRFAEATAAAAVGDPFADVLYGPMLDIRFSERFERFLAWIGPQHKVMGSSGIGRITAANPRARFVGDPEAGIFCHPTIVDGVRPGDKIFDRSKDCGVGAFSDRNRRPHRQTNRPPPQLAIAARAALPPLVCPAHAAAVRGALRPGALAGRLPYLV